MLQMLYGYFTVPREDAGAFDALRARYHRILEDRAGDPAAAFQDSLNAILWQHHPRTRPLTAQDLDAADLPAAMRFFRERFADADDFTFILVGNLDFGAVRPLVLKYIGGLPPLPRRDQWRDTGRTSPPHVVECVIHKGIAPKARTAIVFTGPFDWGNRQSYALSCLAEALRIRLRKEIREEKGGTYGVSVSAFGTQRPKQRYRLQIDFQCDPARLDELTKQVFMAIEAIQQSGIGPDEIEQIREIQRREHETGVRTNSFWVEGILDRDTNGMPLRDLTERIKLADKLSNDQVRKAARTYLQTGRYVRVAMLPETPTAATEPGSGDH